MFSRTIILASSIVAAAAFVAPAQAGSFPIGLLIGGGNWQLPKCTAPEVLTELKDRNTGQSVWRCMKPVATNEQGAVRSASAAPR